MSDIASDTANRHDEDDVHVAAGELVWTAGATADSAFVLVRCSAHARFLTEQRRLVGSGDGDASSGLRLRVEEVYVGVFHGFLVLQTYGDKRGEDVGTTPSFVSPLLAAVARETPPSQFLSAAAATRLRVFRDLWERGFYVTGGSKFSAELLVYDAPPTRSHALALVLVRELDAPFDAVDVASHCRIATMVRKRLVFASCRSVEDESGDGDMKEGSERDDVVYVGVDHALLTTRQESQRTWQSDE